MWDKKLLLLFFTAFFCYVNPHVASIDVFRGGILLGDYHPSSLDRLIPTTQRINFLSGLEESRIPTGIIVEDYSLVALTYLGKITRNQTFLTGLSEEIAALQKTNIKQTLFIDTPILYLSFTNFFKLLKHSYILG